MTYKGHFKWFKIIKNLKIGYNKMIRVNRGKNAHGVITPAWHVSTASKIGKDESPNGIYFW